MHANRYLVNRGRTQLVGGGLLTFGWNEAFGGVGCVYGTDVLGAYRAHVHATFVIAAFEGGTFTVVVDGVPYHAGPGCVLLLSPNQVHIERWGAGTYAAIYPSARVVHDALATTGFRITERAWARPVLHAPALAALVLKTRDAILGGMPSLVVEGMLRTLLRTIDQWAPPLGNALATAREPVIALRDRLHAGIAERPKIAELARALRVSEYHLIRTFHRAVGLPPHAYWEAIRIAAAKEMLIAGRGPRQVTADLGFSDQSHFIRHFKRTVRLTPGRYANMVRRGIDVMR